MTQASTTSLGVGPDGKDVYIPVKDLLPMLDPNNIEFDGKCALCTASFPGFHVESEYVIRIATHTVMYQSFNDTSCKFFPLW